MNTVEQWCCHVHGTDITDAFIYV